MIIKFFDAHEAEKFGISLADFFSERIKLDSSSKKAKTTSQKVEIIKKMLVQVHAFKIKHHPNFYKKAKFANAFKWHLIDKGYDQAFVNELTKDILNSL